MKHRLFWHTIRSARNRIDLSYNDVKCGFKMLHEIGLALENVEAVIQCNINFSVFDVIIRKVYWGCVGQLESYGELKPQEVFLA